MGDVINNFAVDMLSELYRSLRPAGWAYPTTLGRERNEEGVLASIAIHPSGTVSEDAAVEIFVEGIQHLVPQAPILVLEPCLPLDLEIVPRVMDDLVEH
jgi:hypothetical protein